MNFFLWPSTPPAGDVWDIDWFDTTWSSVLYVSTGPCHRVRRTPWPPSTSNNHSLMHHRQLTICRLRWGLSSVMRVFFLESCLTFTGHFQRKNGQIEGLYARDNKPISGNLFVYFAAKEGKRLAASNVVVYRFSRCATPYKKPQTLSPRRDCPWPPSTSNR